jgi:hypothetical protein
MTMSQVSVDRNRLDQIGREITARIEKLDKIGEKAVDHVDSISHLLAEAEKLCDTPQAFEAFKRQHCPKLGQSRTYELLAINEGRKSLEKVRAATRARVAKHRAAKKTVTESDSVTSPLAMNSAPEYPSLPSWHERHAKAEDTATDRKTTAVNETAPTKSAERRLQVDRANSLHRELMGSYSDFEARFKAWLTSTEVEKQAKDMMSNALYLVADGLMRLAQELNDHTNDSDKAAA